MLVFPKPKFAFSYDADSQIKMLGAELHRTTNAYDEFTSVSTAYRRQPLYVQSHRTIPR